MRATEAVKDLKFTRFVLFINCLVPLVLLGWDSYRGALGANPIEFVTRATGTLTLVFLMLSLAVTPVRQLTGANWIIKFRRMLGLYVFAYAFLHFITYIWFDKFFAAQSIVEDTFKRPFIAVGMLSFLLMVPLAVTSTNRMIKRLGGKRWARLHKLIYLIGLGGVVHYWMLVKADTRKPFYFAFILALLLGYRFFFSYLPRRAELITLRTPPR